MLAASQLELLFNNFGLMSVNEDFVVIVFYFIFFLHSFVRMFVFITHFFYNELFLDKRS